MELYEHNDRAEKNDNCNGDKTFVSSTRKKRNSSGNPTIHSSPREYLAAHVVTLIKDEEWPGWVAKEKKNGVTGNFDWVAINDKEKRQLNGYDEILDEAYLSGVYDDFIVYTEVGNDFLKRAGVEEDPYSIFSEELKRRRKRCKQGHDQADLSSPENTQVMVDAMEGSSSGTYCYISISCAPNRALMLSTAPPVDAGLRGKSPAEDAQSAQEPEAVPGEYQCL